MAYWLLKTEPGTYSWDDLVRDRKTVWDGVTNPVALENIRSMKKKDKVLIYHTGKERAAVGVAEVAADPKPDSATKDPKSVVVEIRPLRALPKAVSLDRVKADRTFSGWDLLRIGRLSVVPVPPKMWNRIEAMSGLRRASARSR